MGCYLAFASYGIGNATSIMILFWVCVVALIYTFIGYPLLLVVLTHGQKCLLGRSKDSPELKNASVNLVSVVVVAHNEAARIGFRLRNVLECHPAGSELEIVVVSDGSTDDTVRRANSVGDARIRCLERSSRAGKAACLNAAVAACRGEVVLFADARQRFEPSAVVALIRAFTDPHVGAVSGQLEIEMAVSGAGQGVDAYWRLEKLLRRLEASWDSCVGCTGAIYAIRRCLYQPIEPDTLLDDVVIPMQIAAQGYRVVFESRAIAYDPQSLEPKMEVVRKTRTLAGNFQLLFRHARWLWPWENRLWWQLISHKYLRLATPILLGLALLSNLMLLERPFYVALLGAQLVFYGCAALGFRVRRTMFTAPAGFVFLSWMVVRGFWVYCRKSGGNGWNSSVGPSLSK